LVTVRERVRIFTREFQLRTRTGKGYNSASEAEARVREGPRPSSVSVIFLQIAVDPATYESRLMWLRGGHTHPRWLRSEGSHNNINEGGC